MNIGVWCYHRFLQVACSYSQVFDEICILIINYTKLRNPLSHLEQGRGVRCLVIPSCCPIVLLSCCPIVLLSFCPIVPLSCLVVSSRYLVVLSHYPVLPTPQAAARSGGYVCGVVWWVLVGFIILSLSPSAGLVST